MHKGLIDSPDELARRVRDITIERTVMLGEQPVTYVLPRENFSSIRDMLMQAGGVPYNIFVKFQECKEFVFEGAVFKQQEL